MIRIGNLKLENALVMAPMAGITNLAFRRIAKKMGAGLVTTEMISSVGIVMGEKNTHKYLKTHPDERPLCMQIFGANPETLARAAEAVVAAGADMVDINMGCPAKKVTKTGAGGALLRNPPREIERLFSAVRKRCHAPLTIKIRAGWSPDRMVADEIARIAQDCGVDAVTVHPRFVSQGFSGHADWAIISQIKGQVKIPVIGNGDISNPATALEMKAQTGCDGIMIGRAAIGSPWIFKQILALEKGLEIQGPTLEERKSLMMEHFFLLSENMGEKRAAQNMRGILLWYTKGLPFGRRFRGSFTSIKDTATLTSIMDQYFSALKEHAYSG